MKAITSFGKTTNWLLLGMGTSERTRLWPYCARCRLPVRTHLERTAVRPTSVWFIESGVISSLETGDLREPIEVGVVGREGMIGTTAMANLIPQRDAFVQIEGEALFIDINDFQECLRSSVGLRAYLSRYVQAQMVQISLAASAGVRASVQQRLARKLLMYRDRTDTDDLVLTHESMSLMLGVRRASITHAIHNLEASGFIKARRGLITIRDRQGLETCCGRFYGVAEARYAEIMGSMPQQTALRSIRPSPAERHSIEGIDDPSRRRKQTPRLQHRQSWTLGKNAEARQRSGEVSSRLMYAEAERTRLLAAAGNARSPR